MKQTSIFFISYILSRLYTLIFYIIIKFLCLFIGNPSEWPKPKENSFIRFGDDSFDLRIPDNPLRVSDPKLDIEKSNKVVGFAVDFGIQNQNIFKDLDLDMSEKKNTSETFNLTGYAKGIYIVKIDTKLGSANYKLVIE